MQSFLVATSVVGLAEIGDKTQLLSLVLAARYRKPIPIIFGVLAATLINHAASGALGAWLASILKPSILNWAVVASFAVMAVWILIPDKLDDADADVTKNTMGVFGTTAVTFFLAEMGDKTQIVTIALAARFHEFFGVVAGTTLGMMLANVPVIYLGHKFADRLPTKAVHILAAIIFVVLGGLALRTALYPTAHPMFLQIREGPRSVRVRAGTRTAALASRTHATSLVTAGHQLQQVSSGHCEAAEQNREPDCNTGERSRVPIWRVIDRQANDSAQHDLCPRM